METELERQHDATPVEGEAVAKDLDDIAAVPEDTSSLLPPPERLPNGNWRCAHTCKDGCNHKCCKEGSKKPPKVLKRGASAQRQASTTEQQRPIRNLKRAVVDPESDGEEDRPQPRKRRASGTRATPDSVTRPRGVQALQLVVDDAMTESDSDLEDGLEGLRYATAPPTSAARE